ncbi:hypothetical protein LTR94_033258, partial [Friedmanniomyces endolithicus]
WPVVRALPRHRRIRGGRERLPALHGARHRQPQLQPGREPRPQGRAAGRDLQDRPAPVRHPGRGRHPLRQRLHGASDQFVRSADPPGQPQRDPHHRPHRRLRASGRGRRAQAGLQGDPQQQRDRHPLPRRRSGHAVRNREPGAHQPLRA